MFLDIRSGGGTGSLAGFLEALFGCNQVNGYGLAVKQSPVVNKAENLKLFFRIRSFQTNTVLTLYPARSLVLRSDSKNIQTIRQKMLTQSY